MPAWKHATPPDEERCCAVLKGVWNWRCKRRFVGELDLCAQHHYFGAKIPMRWEDQGTPVGPFFRWSGTRGSAA